MPPSNAQLVAARIQAWNAAHPRARLDTRAVLAVAAQEGLGGGIGDRGTSFGPFQLHRGGALPASIPLSAGQAWAWSPAGIDYALSRIASVAGGQSGGQAVANIVHRFERPANPGGETSRALASLGLPVSAASGYQTGGSASTGAVGSLAGAGTGPDALAALLLSRVFQPPPVDVAGTAENPAVHFEAQPPDHPLDALQLARAYLDATKTAFTNPGFARYLHGLNGTSLPASTIGQSAHGSHTSSPSAGDVAFFGSPPSHQGVMLDGSHFMHGTDGGTVLRVSSLAHPAYQSGLSALRSFH